ncbi:MAG: response regulator [Bacteroides sp.]|nr:response regulator [Bacteroides sp.]
MTQSIAYSKTANSGSGSVRMAGGVNLMETDETGTIRFINHRNRFQNYPMVQGNRVRYVTEVRSGVMMVGTTDGLLTFSGEFDQPEEIRFYRNTRRPDRTNSLSNSDVMQIFTDSREDIYLVTFSGGINRVLSEELLSDTIRFQSYTVNEGLASDLTLSMLESRGGDLWIISENALTRIDPETGGVDNYNTYFLRKEIQFSECIAVSDSRGICTAGGLSGLIQFDPDSISKSDYVPPILFTELRIQGEESSVNLSHPDKLTFAPWQRSLIFRFAALDYVNPEEIRYAYRLKGLEENWNYSEKNRSATYINLPKGKYTFQVRSTNSDGVWTDNIQEMEIELQPLFRETIWAIMLYLGLFIVFTLATVYVLTYIYRLKHEINLEQELSHIKLRFFTDISHELRTPLTLIASPVNEVLEREQISPRVREHLTLVQKNTDRMLNLINQLLDFRKIQNRKMKLLLEETEVNELLKRIRENFLAVAEEKEICYDFLPVPEATYLWVDKDKFEKIFFNLLSNAFKYTPNGKSVTIGVEAAPQEVTVYVRDNGIGIGKEKLDHLFERFENFSTLQMLSPSSGIGLSLVKEFVDMHHARIEVSSTAGEGSEFRIHFRTGRDHFEGEAQVEILQSAPARKQPSAVQSAEAEAEEGPQEDKLTILVVEDNEELQEFLKNILSDGYNVLQARNGKEGLKQAIQRIPDIVISDVMMPEMDGLEMVRRIKDNPSICHIPIVLLTAKSALDDRIHALEQGIDDYITKPFSASYLKTRIQGLLKQRRLLQEIYRSSLTENTPVQRDLTPSQPHVTPYDEVFIGQVMEFIEKNMDNADLAVDDFAHALMLSRTVFYRKLKSVLGMTPTDFIREIRIKRAQQLIAAGQYTFSQIAFMAGFNDPKYFSKCFKKQVGCTPSEYKEKIESTK